MEHHSAMSSFGLENSHVTAIVGGGGKSSLMAALGKEYHRRGETVIMTLPPPTSARPGRMATWATSAAVLGSLLASCRLMTVGTMSEERKFGPSPLLEQLPELADRVIIEADGTKGLPLKVPNDREPVIPAFADAVIAVAGLSALGRPLGEVCHRPELAKLRFDLEPDQIVTPELMAMLLSSPLAQRKDVGSRPYAVLLNQADRARPDEIAALATLLLQKGVERVVTAALQRRPGEYEVWKR